METNDLTPSLSVYPSQAQLTEMEPGDIRKEIELTLAEIDSTIDQLKEAASPQALKAKAMASVKRRVGEAVHKVGTTVGSGVRSGVRSVGSGVRSNPVPLAVSAGALLAGLAFAWRKRALRAMRPAPQTVSDHLRCWLQGL